MARAMALELLGKYEAIRRLRSEATPGAPTLALRALAERFPGALRELDELSLDEIERRLEHLRALAEGRAAGEAWVVPLSLYHRRLRGALLAKRWLRGRRELSADERRDFVEAEGGDKGAEAAVWADQLERLASPPTGRLTDLVLEHVALELGLTLEALAGLLFGEARARRARRRAGALGARHARRPALDYPGLQGRTALGG